MPGPGLVVLMLVPIAVAGLLAVRLRSQLAGTPALRGLWLVPLVVAATIAAARVQASGSADDLAVNRVLAAGVLAAGAGFVLLNRRHRSRPVRWGVGLTVAGAGCNAVATLIYGSMPVLAASSRWLGSDLTAGTRPEPRYVAIGADQLPALVLGDVLPVPGLDAVVSLGDLLLVPGCSILLAAVLAPLLAPLPAPAPREGVSS